MFYCLGALCAAAVLLIAARCSMEFAEWYAVHIFPFFPSVLGRLFSFLPFSVFELLLILVCFWLLLLCARVFLHLIRGFMASPAPHSRLKINAPGLAALLCTLMLMFTLTCGINYNRAPLATALGLEVHPATTQELKQLFMLLCAETEATNASIKTNAAGLFELCEKPQENSRAVMKDLGEAYAFFNTYYPKPKPLVCSTILSYLQLAGIYSPFTIEANFNRFMPPGDLPFTICHELAHLCGFAREDEANFISYIACKNSGNSDFYYSGLLNALSYVLNALYDDIPLAEYREIIACLPSQARKDMRFSANYWHKYAGPAAEFSSQVNNVYLQANNQPEGIKSYGRMIDLLLAYYF